MIGKACRHCKSPARLNPCWWFLDHPEQHPSGGDPPCIGDQYDDDQSALAAMRKRRFFCMSLFIIALLLILLLAVRADEPHHSNPWLLSWIPATCCVTNDCCWEVAEREVSPLPDDHWLIKSTGQVKKRTGWSPDGRFYRCACDPDAGTWVRHQGANTRCLFVSMRAVSR